MKRLLKKDIDQRISLFTKILADSIRHIHGETGWHQHLRSHKVGIVATAMALLYFSEADTQCLEKEQCLHFIRSKIRPEGGWPYISNATNRSNVESTCWALLALNTYDPEGSSQLIERGSNWILNSLDNQNIGNGWGFSEGSAARIYITAFALRTLYKLGKSLDEKYESARQWLVNSQNKDGGWGALPVDGSSIFFTCYCISTLILIGYDPDEKILKDAKSWLDHQIQKTKIDDASLVCYMELIEDGEGENRIRIPFFHYALPSIAKAYMDLGCNNKYLFNSLYILMKRSGDGLIEHPNLESSRIYPIWALYETATSFLDFRQHKKSIWKEKYVFCCFFNRIHSFRKWSPLRPITFFSSWMWGIPIIFVLVLTMTCFQNPIISFWKYIEERPLGGIFISFLASILYGACGWSIKWLKKLFDE